MVGVALEPPLCAATGSEGSADPSLSIALKEGWRWRECPCQQGPQGFIQEPQLQQQAQQEQEEQQQEQAKAG